MEGHNHTHAAPPEDDSSQASTGATVAVAAPAAPQAKQQEEKQEEVCVEDLGTDEDAENGQPADLESLLPSYVSADATAEGAAAPEENAEASPSPGLLEQLQSNVQSAVKDVLVVARRDEKPGNDDEEEGPQQEEESRGKMLCMTLVTIAK